MKYLEWNNLIASYLFNPQNEGKQIFLYLTKPDLIGLAKGQLNNSDEDSIWSDFLTRVRLGLPGSKEYPSIFDKAVYAYQQWKRSGVKSIEGIELTYPPYIAYLIFTVLPLSEIQGTYNANNYYNRLADFLNENLIYQNLKDKLRDIDHLWEDLSNWANTTKNGELGFFRAISFTKTWKFVGKPFSQCVFPPKAIKKLPEMFVLSSMTPNSFYREAVFQEHLLNYGISLLGLKPSAIELIKKGDKDEIGQSIIETVKTEYEKWTGELHETVIKDGIEKIIRKHTVIPLKLQFKINNDGEIGFSYRAKYSVEPPSDLKLDEFNDIYETESWSRTLKRPYLEAFELKDSFHKWIARFEHKELRLFITGGYYYFSRDYWIETESLLRTERMYILAKKAIKQSIEQWCMQNCSDFKDESDLEGLPQDYFLFSFRNPRKSHNLFPQLQVYEHKIILMRGGLKTGYRTYLNQILPEIEIVNAHGEENLVLQYESADPKIILKKHPNLGNVWLLPPEILINRNFVLRVENESFEGHKQTYRVVSADYSNLSNKYFQKKNKFNHEAQPQDGFIQGNIVHPSDKISITVDGQSFWNKANINARAYSESKFAASPLLNWLVAIRNTDIQKYNEAFETTLLNSFPGEQFELQKKRKYAIRLFDSLGYIDYDHGSNILCLPPKLILIPSANGSKALLIGGRDEKLIAEMIAYCAKYKSSISIKIIKQDNRYIELLLPDSVSLESNNREEFAKLSAHLNIEYDEWYILKLKTFIPSLSEYEQFILNKSKSESWEKFGLQRRVFNCETLKFLEQESLNKSYSLVEYTLTSYKREYGMWINNSYYIVDKNWGKYLIVNHFAEKVKGFGGTYFSKPLEIFSGSNFLAIPASLPLPKLFSRILLQLSGEVPDFRDLRLGENRGWYNVYKNTPSLFSENFFRFKLNMNIEKTDIILQSI